MGIKSLLASVKGSIAIVAVTATVAAVAAGTAVAVLVNREPKDTGPLKLEYATSVIALNEASLQQAVDEMYAKAKEGRFVTAYKNEAYSDDGVNFNCYIGNSAHNTYDMYFQIFADSERTDQLYLSQALRPGTGFNDVTLDHALDPGTHRVYVVYTQVEDLTTIKGQTTITMDFIVKE